ncbi:hypothetical protein H7F15_18030 [Pontibacter sp. Tf4]|uniref:hypothetical protein n=1 Tax=Pontibacter sp. Tf4 TaxID=2761620 RepID=UPI0016292488|nr:hypothetical protein [Pontibacter sp. Tf4]MBB6612945.1 hypothetical protein [Pontibacter sp. Tf4]
MKFVLKILAFTALLLISKLTKEDELKSAPDGTPQAIVSTPHTATTAQLPVHKTAGSHPEKDVQSFVATQAAIE